MAKQPYRLSRMCALVLLPPSNIAAPIEAVRRLHDKQFHRWPAHINLLYPFFESASEPGEQEGADAVLKQDLRMRIEKATRKIPPFHISLNANPPGVFQHSRDCTVWLGPTTKSVHDLQAALQAELLHARPDRRPFKPHLSVGKAASQVDVDKVSANIKKSVFDFLSESGRGGAPIALDWYVDRVHVIERKSDKDRFRIIGTIELGKE
jgi:2'-5' RNA ligase